MSKRAVEEFSKYRETNLFLRGMLFNQFPGSVPASVVDKEYKTVLGNLSLADQIVQHPQNYVALTDETALKNLQKTLDLLEDDDDVQAVYHNWDE